MRPVSPFAVLIFLVLSTLAQGGVEYRVKTDGAEVFRTQELQPPAIATLPKGEALTLLHKGSEASLVKTYGEIKGWIRNQDMETVKRPKGKHASRARINS